MHLVSVRILEYFHSFRRNVYRFCVGFTFQREVRFTFLGIQKRDAMLLRMLL